MASLVLITSPRREDQANIRGLAQLVLLLAPLVVGGKKKAIQRSRSGTARRTRTIHFECPRVTAWARRGRLHIMCGIASRCQPGVYIYYLNTVCQQEMGRMTDLLRVPEAAEPQPLDRPQVYAMAQRGELPAVRFGRWAVRIPADQLEAWLAARVESGRPRGDSR